MIQLDWPWIFTLLPLPLLMTLGAPRATDSGINIPAALESAFNDLTSTSTNSRQASTLLLWLSWIALLCSIAQPWTPGDTLAQPTSGRAIALAVDVSGSMERKDFSLNGSTGNRLSIVKQVAGDFIQQRQGDRVSLILYGKSAFIASPLTFDLHSLGSILNSAGIGMAGRSTAIGDAIGLSIQTLSADPATQKAIILLSDGTNNAGSVEPESAAALAQSLNIRIHTIALGSQESKSGGYSMSQSADLDEETLQNIAKAAKGEFFRASTTAELQSIYKTIDTLESAEVEAPPTVVRKNLRQWPQAALLCALLLLSVQRRDRA